MLPTEGRLMTYAYIVGGLAAWGLGSLAVYSLAVAAGRERPTPTRVVVETRRPSDTYVGYESYAASRSA